MIGGGLSELQELENIMLRTRHIVDTDNGGSLRATTSRSTGRYRKSTRVEPARFGISPGLFLPSHDPLPTYLPPHWTSHIHPEGQLYFYRDSPLRVVTESYLYHADILELVIFWANHIENIMVGANIDVTDDMELFLEVDDSGCAYYLIDHASRTHFWVHHVDTEDLGIIPVVSSSHLKFALEELYWSHVEYFPMHHAGRFSRGVVDNLICVFSHAVADHITSPVSTFSYSSSECSKLLKLLRNSGDYISDGHTICFVARLSSTVANHRCIAHYGQEHTRLSRDHPILAEYVTESAWVANLISRLSFKGYDEYITRLNTVYVDNLVYADHWQEFMTASLREWRNTAHWAFSFLVLHIFCLYAKHSVVLVTISSSLLAASLLSSVLLQYRHEPLEKAGASEAIGYLYSVQSERFKFQLVALAYSLPRALCFWGLGMLVLSWIITMGRHLGAAFASGFFIFTVLAVLAFQSTTTPHDTEMIYHRMVSRILGLKEAIEPIVQRWVYPLVGVDVGRRHPGTEAVKIE